MKSDKCWWYIQNKVFNTINKRVTNSIILFIAKYSFFSLQKQLAKQESGINLAEIFIVHFILPLKKKL